MKTAVRSSIFRAQNESGKHQVERVENSDHRDKKKYKRDGAYWYELGALPTELMAPHEDMQELNLRPPRLQRIFEVTDQAELS
jgi:hypothetical protein